MNFFLLAKFRMLLKLNLLTLLGFSGMKQIHCIEAKLILQLCNITQQTPIGQLRMLKSHFKTQRQIIRQEKSKG